MALLDQLRGYVPSFLDDPAPSYAFELSSSGISVAIRAPKRGQAPELRFQPFESDVLAVSPVNDNVLLPDAFAAHVASLVKLNGKRRDAVDGEVGVSGKLQPEADRDFAERHGHRDPHLLRTVLRAWAVSRRLAPWP